MNIKEDLCPLCQGVTDLDRTTPFRQVEDIISHFDYIRHKRQEYFICLSLDSGQRPIACRLITIGLLDVALVHPREVFAGPLKDRAASVIVAHNHPSGEVEPSSHDIAATQQLVAAGQLLGVAIQDHIVVTANGYFSFKERNLL